VSGSSSTLRDALSAEELACRADLTLAAALRHFAEHAQGGESEVDGGVVLFRGAHSYPGAYTNGALRLDRAVSADAALASARSFFSGARRSYAFWTREGADDDLADAVRAAGWFERPPADGMPAMVLDEPGEEGAAPRGVRIVPVADLRAGEDYLMVVARAYGLEGIDTPTAAAMFFDPACLLVPDAAAFVAYLGKTAVAGAMTVAGGGAAGIYWAATLPEARGRRLGELCARRAVCAGFELGGGLVALQSSQMGRSLWQRLGFREVGRYRRYLSPGAA
jgi:ribosomal protein S18 acetylase RimI-like enzyme